MHMTLENLKNEPQKWQQKIDDIKSGKKPIPHHYQDEENSMERCIASGKRLKEGSEYSFKCAELVLDLIDNQGYTIDLRGHSYTKSHERFVCYVLQDNTMSDYHWEVLQNILNGESPKEQFELNGKTLIQIGKTNERNCYKCGISCVNLFLDIEEKHFFVMHEDVDMSRDEKGKIVFTSTYTDEDCMYKNGFGEYSVEINIPSGKMLFANHFHKYYDWTKVEGNEDKEYEDEFSINVLHGRKRVTEEQAKLNCVELNIGSWGCKMYQTTPEADKFVVGYYDDEYETHMEKKPKVVGDVCTDYWGYYVVDKDDYISKAGKDDLSEISIDSYGGYKECTSKSLDLDVSEIDCVPGRYRFTHRFHLGGRDDGVYTNIERVGDC